MFKCATPGGSLASKVGSEVSEKNLAFGQLKRTIICLSPPESQSSLPAELQTEFLLGARYVRFAHVGYQPAASGPFLGIERGPVVMPDRYRRGERLLVENLDSVFRARDTQIARKQVSR